MSKKPIEKLLNGFEKFYLHHYIGKTAQETQELVHKGQSPDVLIISCNDSRSDPDALFDTDMGQAFIGRHIAALVPPYNPDGPPNNVNAEIQYAVENLKVSDIIVIGHTHCGGIEALVEDKKTGDIGKWIQQAAPVLNTVKKEHPALKGKDLATEVEKESIIWSINNLPSYPTVHKALQEKS